MEFPITASEVSEKFYDMVGTIRNGYKCYYSVIPLQHQLKIVGTFNHLPNISTFTIELTPDFARRFVNEDLPALVHAMKESFYKFIRTSYKYTTPFEHHSSQTIFYSMTQTNIRMLETIPAKPSMRPPRLEIPDIPPTPAPLVIPSTSAKEEETISSNPPVFPEQGKIFTSDGKILMPPPPPPNLPPLPTLSSSFDVNLTSKRKRPLTPTDYISIPDGQDYQ